jgi:hypothetical protein
MMPSFLVERDLTNFFPRMVKKPNPLHLFLQCSWDYKCEPLCPALLEMLKRDDKFMGKCLLRNDSHKHYSPIWIFCTYWETICQYSTHWSTISLHIHNEAKIGDISIHRCTRKGTFLLVHIYKVPCCFKYVSSFDQEYIFKFERK